MVIAFDSRSNFQRSKRSQWTGLGAFIITRHKSCEFFINRRGPDHQNTYEYSKLINSQHEINFIFTASVLWLQGENLTQQPIITEESVFLFNGDIFHGITELDRKRFGDTQLLFDRLKNNESIPLELNKVNGPYAFIYLDKTKLRLYFGCDVFGRRSLLIGKNEDVLVLSSVANKNIDIDFIEVPPIGTFCIDLEENEVTLYPWSFKNGDFDKKLNDLSTILKTTIKIIQNIPLKTTKLNFFEPSPDDLKVYENIKMNQNGTSPFEILLSNKHFIKNVVTLLQKLENSIKTRILNQPKFCRGCIKTKNVCDHSTIGVLFSGGVDCTILSVLIDKYYNKTRPIDLINVAFERNENYETPDRETGRKSLEELQRVCPERTWNFIEANISKKELDQIRNDHIKHLIHPLNRILDDSLGCALWFASRGIGKFASSSRVLIVGMGADELFGGYCRLRGKMKTSGWKGLHDSLEEDWENISRKNLARDDRVVSDHGRQLRTPYLDENVVEFAKNLHCWEKTYPSDDFPRGLGEKILLRTLAYQLGLKNAALLKKRAFQFGSRIACSKENAFDVSPRL